MSKEEYNEIIQKSVEELCLFMCQTLIDEGASKGDEAILKFGNGLCDVEIKTTLNWVPDEK